MVQDSALWSGVPFFRYAVIWQFVWKLVNKVSYTKYQVLFHLWLMETVPKLYKTRKYYEPDCLKSYILPLSSLKTI